MKHKRTSRTRMYNLLNSQYLPLDFDGFAWILKPNEDTIAWQALEFYADHTPNAAQRQAITRWLQEHPDPGEPVAEQLGLGL